SLRAGPLRAVRAGGEAAAVPASAAAAAFRDPRLRRRRGVRRPLRPDRPGRPEAAVRADGIPRRARALDGRAGRLLQGRLPGVRARGGLPDARAAAAPAAPGGL